MTFWERTLQAKELVGTLIVMIAALVYFVIDTKNAHETIKELSDAKEILEDKVSRLEGQSEGFNNAVKMFMETPPGVIMNELEHLEEEVKRYHPNATVTPTAPSGTLEEVTPPGGR